jgi:hypothetical protein
MGVLYIEGVAIHGGPESCVGVRGGVGEALAGVRAGGAIEPRKATKFGVPTLCDQAEGEILGGVMRESSGGPARSWEPRHARDALHAREPGGPMIARQSLMMSRPSGSRGGISTAGRAARGRPKGRSLR